MFLQEDPKQRQNTQDIPMRGHSKHVEYYKDGDTPVLPPGLAHEHQAHKVYQYALQRLQHRQSSKNHHSRLRESVAQ